MNNILNKLNIIEDKIIFVCSSPYNILIAVLLIVKANLYGRVCIVMPTYSQKNKVYFAMLSERLEKMGICTEVIDKHNVFWRAVGLADIQNTAILKRVLRKLHTDRNTYYLVNHTWDRDKVCYPASLYFRYCKKTIFIEEGCTQYVTPKEAKWKLVLKQLYGNQMKYWEDSRLEGIYVQEPKRFVGYNPSKMSPFELKIDLGKDEENQIIDIFMNESEKEELQEMRGKRKGIIFTQPFSEDGWMTETQKIHLYEDLSTYYTRYGKVYLKVHPRDVTEYHIANVNILKGSYPSELFSILNVEFDFAIGICTSAVETVDAKNKRNLNENFMTELKYELIPLKV